MSMRLYPDGPAEPLLRRRWTFEMEHPASTARVPAYAGMTERGRGDEEAWVLGRRDTRGERGYDGSLLRGYNESILVRMRRWRRSASGLPPPVSISQTCTCASGGSIVKRRGPAGSWSASSSAWLAFSQTLQAAAECVGGERYGD